MDSYFATNDSPQVIATKARIQSAFLQLLEKKNIEQIRIGEITKLAQLNRTSFYRYYQDIYDLYYQILNDYIVIIQQNISQLLQKIIQQGSFTQDDTPLEFFSENQQILKLSLQDPVIITQLKKQNKLFLKQALSLSETDESIDYILEYLIAGQINLISYWLQNQTPLSMEALFSLSKQILFSGPLTVLFEKVQKD